MIGNAVPPNLSYHLASQIFKQLKNIGFISPPSRSSKAHFSREINDVVVAHH